MRLLVQCYNNKSFANKQMGIILEATLDACSPGSEEDPLLDDRNEYRSGLEYHNNYVVKDTGAQVKEAYFPLECVEGDFKFQIVIKFVW